MHLNQKNFVNSINRKTHKMKPLALKYCFIIAITTTLLTYTYQNCSDVINTIKITNSKSTTIAPDLDQLVNESETNKSIAIINYNYHSYRKIMTD